jgi:hypothetical protein
MAANAQADCDPFLLSMTPQPVPACQAPDVAPPPDQPAIAPVNDVAMPLPAEVPPPAEPGPFGDVQAPVPLLLPDGSVRGEHHYFELEIHLAGSFDAHTVRRLIDFPS